MKQFFYSLLLLTSFSFLSLTANSQHSHSVQDIFLLLPDSIFTNIHQLNFAEVDSFPIMERNQMLADYEAGKHSYTSKDPRFHVVGINEKNRLLNCSNTELNLNVKVWTISDNEILIAVDGNYKDFDMSFQSIKFYSYTGGKLTPVKAMPDVFPASQFFDAGYLERKKMNPSYPVPDLIIEFSKTNDDLKVKVQPEVFDPEIVGVKGHPLTHLDENALKNPFLIYTLQNGKFVLKEQPVKK